MPHTMGQFIGTPASSTTVPRDIDGAPLGPVQALVSGFRNIATFSGRASRSAYWWFALWNTLLMFAAYMAVTAAYLAIAGMSDGAYFILLAMAVLPLFVAQLSVGARRLHDSNMSAGWLWLQLVPYVGGLVLFVLMLRDPRDPNAYQLPAGSAGDR